MRLLALIVILIPGLIAVYGVKLMRDSFFSMLQWPFPNGTIQFIVGFVIFLIGLTVIGGFIYHRDQKRHKVTKGLRKRKSLSK